MAYKKESASQYVKHRSEQHLEYVRSIKEIGCCAICGEGRSVCLDFHHREGTTKVFSLSKPTTRSISAIDAEIRKCDLICTNCHRILHAQKRIKVLAAADSSLTLFD